MGTTATFGFMLAYLLVAIAARSTLAVSRTSFFFVVGHRG
jgi:hypothetical protein